MNELANRRCQPCDGKTPALTLAQAQAAHKQLASEWRLIEDGKAIKREFSFRDFYRTMSFVNALAHIANIEDHHPDLEIGYNYCRVRYSTHAVQGLSDNDFICAAKIDRLPLR
jgi:4a-hydroxytetrahydrobiopterin dehydratase